MQTKFTRAALKSIIKIYPAGQSSNIWFADGATSDKVSEPTTSQSWCWLCATENSLYLFNSSS